jgi:hypothetical protein
MRDVNSSIFSKEGVKTTRPLNGSGKGSGMFTPLLHKDVVESTVCPHQKAVSTFLRITSPVE